jgi:hypothetical protein
LFGQEIKSQRLSYSSSILHISILQSINLETRMENERDNDDGERLPPNGDMGTKNHDCRVPAIPSNTVQTMSMEIGKVGISDNGLKDITRTRYHEGHSFPPNMKCVERLGFSASFSPFSLCRTFGCVLPPVILNPPFLYRVLPVYGRSILVTICLLGYSFSFPYFPLLPFLFTILTICTQ